MDGEHNGKTYFLMDDLGGENPLFLVQHPFTKWARPEVAMQNAQRKRIKLGTMIVASYSLRLNLLNLATPERVPFR